MMDWVVEYYLWHATTGTYYIKNLIYEDTFCYHKIVPLKILCYSGHFFFSPKGVPLYDITFLTCLWIYVISYVWCYVGWTTCSGAMELIDPLRELFSMAQM